MAHLTDEDLVFRLKPTSKQKSLLCKIRGSARLSYNEAVKLFDEGKMPEKYDFYAAITDESGAFVRHHPYLRDSPLITRQMAVDEACIAQRRLQKDGGYLQGRREVQTRSLDYKQGFYFGLGSAKLRVSTGKDDKVSVYLVVDAVSTSTWVEIAFKSDDSRIRLETQLCEDKFEKLALVHRDERDNWSLILR